jgi:hypothetical protein
MAARLSALGAGRTTFNSNESHEYNTHYTLQQTPTPQEENSARKYNDE